MGTASKEDEECSGCQGRIYPFESHTLFLLRSWGRTKREVDFLELHRLSGGRLGRKLVPWPGATRWRSCGPRKGGGRSCQLPDLELEKENAKKKDVGVLVAMDSGEDGGRF